MQPPLHIRFGEFELDEDVYELRYRGRPVVVEPRPLALLIHLARNRHRVVRRDDVLEALWPGVVVSDDALARAILKARKALGEGAGDKSVIQTVRGVGFRFVATAEVVEDGGAAPQPERSVPPQASAALVGREDELGRLREALAASLGGSGRVALIAGAAGVGKTRLASEVAAQAREAGADVREAAAREGAGAPAFWLWVQLLRSYVDEWSDERLADTLGSGAGEVARLVPALAERLALTPAAPSNADEARFRLLDAMAEFLRRAARQRPQVLVLEDLQWADAASLRALAFLAGELLKERVLLLGTYRVDEVERDHPLHEMVAECERHEALVPVPLKGLDADGVARLVRGTAGFEPSADLARSLHGRTDGNPFFVKQLIGLVVSERGGDPRQLADELAARMDALPGSVRRVLLRRIAALSEGCRAVLGAASVWGTSFGVARLARTSSLPRDGLLSALDEAVRANVVEPHAGPERGHRFVHALVRECVYAELEEPVRLTLHRRAAETLEVLHAGHLEPVVSELAYHYGEAAPLLESSQAVDYAKWAGELAREAFSYEEAVAHFCRALDALELLPAPDPARRAELLVCLGYAYQSAGHAEQGRQILREGAAVARDFGAAQLFATAVVGFAGLAVVVDDPEAVALLEEARIMLGDGKSVVHVWLQSILAARLANRPDRLREAENLSERAEAMARELDDARYLSGALTSRAAVVRITPWGRPDQRLALLSEAVELAETCGDGAVELIARLQRMGALVELGDGAGVDAERERIHARLARMRSPYWSYARPTLQAMRALLDGEYEAAEALAKQAAQAIEGHHMVRAAYLTTVIAMVRYEQGRLSELLPVMEQAAAAFPAIPAFRVGHLLAQLQAGQEAEARAGFEAIAEADFSDVVGTESWLVTTALLAELCVQLGDKGRGKILADLLGPREGHCLIVATGHYCHGPAALYLSMLARLAGDFDEAERQLAIAEARCESLDSRVWRVHVQAERARVLGARGDRCQAGRLARRALQAAESLGIGRLRHELRALASP